MFQKLTMLEKDRFLKKQINYKFLLFLLFILFTIIFSKNLYGQEKIRSEIIQYVKSLNQFSSKFIQSDGHVLEEGHIYIKGSKIRLDYFLPSRTLKINDKKGVYINHELREEEFFSTEKNVLKEFYDIFLNLDFFSSVNYKVGLGGVIFKKEIDIDSIKYNLIIYFENEPIILRKITAKSKDSFISLSFSDHSYNNVFEEGFFSFVPLYLD